MFSIYALCPVALKKMKHVTVSGQKQRDVLQDEDFVSVCWSVATQGL